MVVDQRFVPSSPPGKRRRTLSAIEQCGSPCFEVLQFGRHLGDSGAPLLPPFMVAILKGTPLSAPRAGARGVPRAGVAVTAAAPALPSAVLGAGVERNIALLEKELRDRQKHGEYRLVELKPHR